MTANYIYDSRKSGSGIIHEIKELSRYRFLLLLMIRTNILSRYKRSVLGVLWTVLNPLLMMLVISYAFSVIFDRLPSYPVYVLSGMILWNFFTQTTSLTIRSLIWGGGLIGRIYFPKSTIIFSHTGTGIVNLLLSLIPMVAIMLIYRQPFTLSLLFLPVAILITGIFILGISLFLSAFAVFFSDVVDLYNALLRALFYLTPVMYPADVIPEQLSFFMRLNPITSFITLFRTPIYEGTLPSLELIGTTTAFAVITFILGGRYFIRKFDEISYRI